MVFAAASRSKRAAGNGVGVAGAWVAGAVGADVALASGVFGCCAPTTPTLAVNSTKVIQTVCGSERLMIVLQGCSSPSTLPNRVLEHNFIQYIIADGRGRHR